LAKFLKNSIIIELKVVPFDAAQRAESFLLNMPNFTFFTINKRKNDEIQTLTTEFVGFKATKKIKNPDYFKVKFSRTFGPPCILVCFKSNVAAPYLTIYCWKRITILFQKREIERI
jgi:hypothetical protein